MTMQERIDAVRERMAEACTRSGRSIDEVRLVAVSKTYPPERVEEAAACGLHVFGENRVNEAEAKIPACSSSLEWELIGHLQRNKVRRVIPLFRMIQAVDSLELLAKIDSCAKDCGKTMPVCLEVNVSGEGSKFGFAPDAVTQALEAATTMINVDVVGVMTIPPFTPDPEDVRPVFARLRELRDKWADASGFALSELSMGMSGDFEVAIEEGSTCVRVGTAIFGSRA
jgi:pyridoxal phosphate enzyme (YggS family)